MFHLNPVWKISHLAIHLGTQMAKRHFRSKIVKKNSSVKTLGPFQTIKKVLTTVNKNGWYFSNIALLI